jgi:DNA (cytosine-5)-methyltransferase 1
MALGSPVRVIWHAETDDAMTRVLAARAPGVPNLDDITKVDWRQQLVPDIVCSGFPCQPTSAAGRREGESDARWLFDSGVMPMLVALRPAYVFIENTMGLVQHARGALFARVLADLRALGYLVRWLTIGACAIGACHHRHRVFVWCERVATGRPGETLRVPTTTCATPPRRNKLLPSPVARDGDESGRGEGTPAYWAARAAERPTEGMPLGAAVRLLTMMPTPQASDAAGRGTCTPELAADRLAGGRRNVADAVATLMPTPRFKSDRTSRRAAVSAHSRSAPSLEQAVEIVEGRLPRELNDWSEAPASWQPADGRWGRYTAAVERQTAWCGPPPAPTEPNRNGLPRLAAAFPEWMMGLPAGWLTGVVDRAPSLRGAGNGVMPQQGAAALRLLTGA